MMFIDHPDGVTVSMPFTNDVLEAAERAKEIGGRLRLVVSGSLDTRDPAIGCIVLGDYRPTAVRHVRGSSTTD